MLYQQYINVVIISLISFLTQICSLKLEHLQGFDGNLEHKHNASFLHIEPEPLDPRDGIFQHFARRLLLLLTTDFRINKLKNFIRTLRLYIEPRSYRYTKRLGKTLHQIEKLHKDSIRDELNEYLVYLDSYPPKLREFLAAMDRVFNAQHAQQFDDYIYELRNYGHNDKLDMNDETKKLINTIIDRVNSRPTYEIIEIIKKMRKALKEHRYGVMPDIPFGGQENLKVDASFDDDESDDSDKSDEYSSDDSDSSRSK